MHTFLFKFSATLTKGVFRDSRFWIVSTKGPQSKKQAVKRGQNFLCEHVNNRNKIMPKSEFYLRYYVGHKGKFGHEFLEFEFRPDGNSLILI